MFSFAPFIDLPLVWGGLIALAIIFYVILDGFDLGIGILFPFAPSDDCRDKMMNSIAPFWDGNETWLVLGGGGLFAAFPLAYATLLPALYIPVIIMLIGLIFRGVAFEFRFKSEGQTRRLWGFSFHFGSLVAALMQGIILGAFVQGMTVIDRQFVGGTFDWLTGFSIMTGVALVFGYALLGSSWLIMKTDYETQHWARTVTRYALIYVIAFMVLVSAWVPFIDPGIATRWFSWPDIAYLSVVPFLVLLTIIFIVRSVIKGREVAPFFLSIFLFLLGYAGLAISLWPWVVPFSITLREASASPESQSLLLVGIVLFLPFVLAYTGYNYYVFRGKAHKEKLY